jgi:hypothetical protein
MARGGKRIGSGRKKSTEPTITIRVPISKKERIKKWLNTETSLEKQEKIYQNKITGSLNILDESLKLKANAGGKIKIEIRKVIQILQQMNY